MLINSLYVISFVQVTIWFISPDWILTDINYIEQNLIFPYKKYNVWDLPSGMLSSVERSTKQWDREDKF